MQGSGGRLRRLLGAPGARAADLEAALHDACWNESDAPFFKWFEDGKLNVSYNCLDRHVEAGRGDQVAIIFEADDGTTTRVTYAELLARTAQLANALKARGVKKGDRVVIYMPMSVEGVVAMQACARIGATHSVVFGGFSAQSLRDRVQRRRRRDGADRRRTAARRQVAAAQGHRRRGHAPTTAAPRSSTCIVYKRTGGNIAWVDGRDKWLHDAVVRPVLELRAGMGRAPSTRSSCSTPRARPASPRACSTAPAATCCMPR